jgi:hypothetical protein
MLKRGGTYSNHWALKGLNLLIKSKKVRTDLRGTTVHAHNVTSECLRAAELFTLDAIKKTGSTPDDKKKEVAVASVRKPATLCEWLRVGCAKRDVWYSSLTV